VKKEKEGTFFLLKMAKLIHEGDGESVPKDSNGNPYIPELIINFSDIVKVLGSKVDTTFADKGLRERTSKSFIDISSFFDLKIFLDFMTDTDISGGNGALHERELHKWTPDDSITDQSLLSMDDGKKHRAGDWDQFAANEKLFGVSTDYKEELYTTKLDRGSDEYKKREREAQRIAEEISKSSASNVHLAEERGQAIDDGVMDEEDRYGAVVRGSAPRKPQGTNRPSYASASSAASNAKPSSPVKRNGAANSSTGKPSIRQDALAKLEKTLLSNTAANGSVVSTNAQANPSAAKDSSNTGRVKASQNDKVAKDYSEFSQQQKAKEVAEFKNFSQQLKASKLLRLQCS
jgi:PAB1-binding protein PBP1